MTSKVETVVGEVDLSELGRTLTHEHLGMSFAHFYRKPPLSIADKFSSFELENAGFIRQYPYSSKLNLELNDSDAFNALYKDLVLYKKLGGGTIVENSTHGLERNVDRYRDLSNHTGVRVVAGTGFYITDMQSADKIHSTHEELYNLMLKELTEGCVDSPNIKAGFIGEIASVWPITEFERKVIKATGELQAQLRCGVSFHPHRESAAPAEILRLYAEAGGRLDKAVMSHLDRTLLEPEKLLDFAELGSFCQFDLFGTEVSYYQLNVHTDMPSDAQRLSLMKRLLDDGRVNQLLMSHDIHTKHRLVAYGGHGYSHIINNVIPRMKSRGFSQQVIDQITITNPAEWLAMPK